ncbi:MAG: stress-induced protein [Ktedonobacteraceae bacterium]|nr:stress-induced protein [Ktedonobacteraceae bacterium]MBO0793454.1 stress-induced protein [Ktedonobacteraceae bacterium]
MPAEHEKRSQAGRKGGEAVSREQHQKAGRMAHQKGNAHEWNSEEARQAGSKGGHAAHEKGTAHEWNSREARRAGSKGGHSRNS